MRQQDMLQVLRFRICNAAPDADLLLHEGKLALEFGVSRTPIRQVLHRLAFERLVETRSGIGTVVSPLSQRDRSAHIAMLAGILRLGKLSSVSALDLTAKVAVSTIVEIAASRSDASPDNYFAVQARLVELVTSLLLDPIAIEAHAAMHWRAIRWNMQAVHIDASRSFTKLNKMLRALKTARSPAEILEVMADAQPQL